MQELELTFLAGKIPDGLARCEHREIIDIYIPKKALHPYIRIRKDGGKHVITKKKPEEMSDFSKFVEHSIHLTPEEFDVLSTLDGKRLHKLRYFYPIGKHTAEIDVFQGPLKGLVVVEVEFDTEKEKADFNMPGFCLADVTQEEFIAGGMLCGKSYEDVEPELRRFNYKRLQVRNDS
jgi:CYTH domain-containing protein